MLNCLMIILSESPMTQFVGRSTESATYSPPKPIGRLIYYHIADENGEIDETVEGYSLTFKGNTDEELTLRLEEESGLRDIVVCNHSPLNGKLHPLRLQLPPNNATVHVVVVQSSSISKYWLPLATLLHSFACSFILSAKCLC
ncbi:hypothetical protein Nepgr_005107 [Nepenthes gracilis]|uniref:DUF569 domain-containing protein n=1 Tax=Nepenthes gracilis TaxID=150966 RepID=A0AAD3XG05_NEPGR|nr:hypothetical protein Nepgr_005107 [Nepenthes gracilis]